ncbi:hypothetical protein T492DRAFT_929394 [Pavlovales sp. CCMP2436]|nr:hypothetical protein T492DRAFT_929394 [Pavlovales sp. CCMP2436]|mmetsp:Transcript_34213/g.85204  ORF Transcript_34213/g.85204 Transcript_34213/m.85204 type:complete len:246 (-) Transcript_34213:232-969(-)
MPPPTVTDSAIMCEVGAVGGRAQINAKGLWPVVAQRLGLKGNRALEVQQRYELILQQLPPDSEEEDEPEADNNVGMEDESEGDEESAQEVERIIGERIDAKGQKFFRVKWAQTADESTWEPAAHMTKCTDKLREWNERKKCSEASERHAEPAAGPGRKRELPAPGADAYGRVKRPNRPHHDGQPVRIGLVASDEIVRVHGPVNMQLQWLVGWRSGATSLMTNAQVKEEAPLVLIEWYESQVVIDE